jgi:two-component system, OmpR family, response regulator
MTRGTRPAGPYTLRLVNNMDERTGSLKLLCVDDEEDIRTIIEMSLALDASINAEIVSDGQSLLARASSGAYDAFLLDAMMPEMDGYEVCRRLKQDPATRDVPIVFLTARTQRDDIEMVQQLGAVGCLKKPFDPLTIAVEIRNLLRLAA